VFFKGKFQEGAKEYASLKITRSEPSSLYGLVPYFGIWSLMDASL
jgi:hypothetical protein